MYQSRAHSNTNEVLPEKTYYYVIYSSSFLENILGILSENKTCNMFLLIDKKNTIKKNRINLPTL